MLTCIKSFVQSFVTRCLPNKGRNIFQLRTSTTLCLRRGKFSGMFRRNIRRTTGDLWHRHIHRELGNSSSKEVAQSQVILQFSIFPMPGNTRSSKIFAPLHSTHRTDLQVRINLLGLYVPFWMLSDFRWPGQRNIRAPTMADSPGKNAIFVKGTNVSCTIEGTRCHAYSVSCTGPIGIS